MLGLIEDTLRDAGLSPLSVVGLATVGTKADEPGIAGAAARLGVPVRGYAAGLLAGIAVPNPSGAPLAAVGTPSVAEAAALAAGGELLVPKRKSNPEGRSAAVTCAVASCPGPPRVAAPGVAAQSVATPPVVAPRAVAPRVVAYRGHAEWNRRGRT